MESAFERRALLHLHGAFNLTTAGRNIQGPSLPLLLLTRKGTSKLGRKSWLDTSVFRATRRWDVFGTFWFHERTEFFH